MSASTEKQAFGGAVTGSSIASSSNTQHDKSRKQTTSTRAPKAEGFAKLKSLEVEKTVNDHIGATLSICHAFGNNALTIDGLQSFAVPSAGSDKDTTDMLLYRVGKQLCIADYDSVQYAAAATTQFQSLNAKQQHFLHGRLKTVKNITHFCLGHNNRVIAVCETLRVWDSASDINVQAQVSVYSLNNYHKMKTLNYSAGDDFVQVQFCGDPKYLACMTGEKDRKIVIFLWEKDKVHKEIDLASFHITRMRVAPCMTLMITTSGKSIMRSWFFGLDGTAKQGHILASNRECENFLDHIWLPSPAGTTHMRMIALCDYSDNSSEGSAVGFGGASAASFSSSSGLGKQNVLILEGDLVENNSNMTTPVTLELKKMISMRIFDHNPSMSSPSTHHHAPGGSHGSSHSNRHHSIAATGAGHGRASVAASESGAARPSGLGAEVKELPKIENIVATSKGFMLIGGKGFIAMFERHLDKKESFVEVRRLHLGDLEIACATTIQGEEKLTILTKNNRLLTYALGSDTDLLSGSSAAKSKQQHVDANDEDETIASLDSDSGDVVGLINAPAACHDLYRGGAHAEGIVAADIAVEKPLLVTIGHDNACRAWNFESMTCTFVHNFRSDEPLAVAAHPSGFQILVSFKDRVKQYNVLHDKLKQYKDTMTKNCKELRYSNSGNLWAAASGIAVYIFDSITSLQLALFTGHTGSIKRLVWAPGDEVVFSAGTDGNIYGWPISREHRIDVVSSSNRASSILSIAVDSPNLLFPKPASFDSESEKDVKAGLVAAPSIPLAELRQMCCSIVLSTGDGMIKTNPWPWDGCGGNKSDSKEKLCSSILPKGIAPIDNRVSITALLISKDRNYLFAGTSIGTVRAYSWPPNGNDVAYAECWAHNSPVQALRESPQGNLLMSAAEDGTIFMISFLLEQNKAKSATVAQPGGDNGTSSVALSLSDMMSEYSAPVVTFNKDVVLMAADEVDDHNRLVARLKNDLIDAAVKAEYRYHEMETEYQETIRKRNEQHEVIINDERHAYVNLKADLERKLAEVGRAMSAKESEHSRVLTELENRYEHKLADQMERYDHLVEEMEALKQSCEATVVAERKAFEKKLDGMRVEAQLKEKKLKTENRRIAEDRVNDTNSFKEILDQQENEYEKELKDLINSAESELANERDTITKLRTLVQTKVTKVDQLKKKLIELDRVNRGRKLLLEAEKKDKLKLQETIEHYKKNLKEREEALMEKEKIIIDLRSTTRTLENFRFVLDHRLQQLSSERGPITAHIEGLEKHITAMYEELIDVFDVKKSTDKIVEIKDKKIALLQNELRTLNVVTKQHETLIHAFKRDVANIVNSNAGGKSVEESLRTLYKKYVRGEKVSEDSLKASGGLHDIINEFVSHTANDDTHGRGGEQLMHQIKAAQSHVLIGANNGMFHATASGGSSHAIVSAHAAAALASTAGVGNGKAQVKEIEEALIESAKEAERQKGFVERASSNLQHRLESTKFEMHRISKIRLAENSSLLFECNNMRREIKDLQRKLDIANSMLAESRRSLRAERKSRENDMSPDRAISLDDIPYQASSARALTDSVPDTPAGSVRSKAPISTPSKDVLAEMSAMPPPAGPPTPKIRSRQQQLFSLEDGKRVPLHSALESVTEVTDSGVTLPSVQRQGNLADRLSAISLMSPVKVSSSLVGPSTKGSLTLLVSPQKKVHGKKSREEMLLSAAGKEIEQLSSSLDESYREKEMQRKEISRLRALLAQQMLGSAPTTSQSYSTDIAIANTLSQTPLPGIMYDDFVEDSELPFDESIADADTEEDSSVRAFSKADRNLTTADVTGRPSSEDLLDIALMPVSSAASRKSSRR